MRASAVVVAAGRGLRLKSKIPKPLVKIDSKPLIIYCLLTLQHHPLVSEIILVVNSGNKKAIAGKLKLYRIGKVRSIVKGPAQAGFGLLRPEGLKPRGGFNPDP